MATYEVHVTTTGTAGSATGTGDTPIVDGFIEGIKLTYHASAPAGTTDVTVTEVAAGSEATLAQTILTRTNTATSGTFYPERASHDNTGTANGATQFYKVYGKIRVTVAQCDALTDAVVATIRVLETENVR